MGLPEQASDSHVAPATGPVPPFVPPPPHCSPVSPTSDPLSLSQVNPTLLTALPPDPTAPSPSAVAGGPDPLPASCSGGAPPVSPSFPVLSSDLAAPAASATAGGPNPSPALSSGGHPPVASSAPGSSSDLPPVLSHPPCSAPIKAPSRLFRPSSSSSDPIGSAPPPQQLSYAQAARSGRGPGFVRAHASDVEHFARVPRTGANIICGSREGMPSFSFVASDLPKVEDIYLNALVMKFSGGRPSLEASHKAILSWGMEKPFSIGPLSSRAFLLRFQDGKDLLKVLTRPSSLLITSPYKVFRWHSLCHLSEDSSLAPVWISLPHLPLQCFIPEFLEAVGNKLGKFLCFDRATSTLARPSTARICVELELRKLHPQSIWIGLFDGFKQPVIYERLPKYCNHCHLLGHISAVCPKVCTGGLASSAGTPNPLLKERPQHVRHNAKSLARPISDAVERSSVPAAQFDTPSDAENLIYLVQAQPPPACQPASKENPRPSPLPTDPVLSTNYATTSSFNSHESQLIGALGRTPPLPSLNGSLVSPTPVSSYNPQLPSSAPKPPQPSSSTLVQPSFSADPFLHVRPPAICHNASEPISSDSQAVVDSRAPSRADISLLNDDLPPSKLVASGTPSHLTSPQPPHQRPTPSASPLSMVTLANHQQHQLHPIIRHRLEQRLSASDISSRVQSNLDANSNFWSVVERHVAILDQARISSSDTKQFLDPNVEASFAMDSTNKHSHLAATAQPASLHCETRAPPCSHNLVEKPLHHSSDESPSPPVEDDSDPNSPSAIMVHDQQLAAELAPATYDSDGEDPSFETPMMQGYYTDDFLGKVPPRSRRNKRHPDQPLKVQLRARKKPQSYR